MRVCPLGGLCGTMGLCGALVGLLLASLLSQARSKVIVVESEDRVLLTCDNGIEWKEGTLGVMIDSNKTMDLGKYILDPRGLYSCGQEAYRTQIYYRMCQSCVELDATTLAGMLVGNIIATLLLALGVYCFAGHEAGRLSGAR